MGTEVLLRSTEVLHRSAEVLLSTEVNTEGTVQRSRCIVVTKEDPEVIMKSTKVSTVGTDNNSSAANGN